jgi:hypothetical protein
LPAVCPDGEFAGVVGLWLWLWPGPWFWLWVGFEVGPAAPPMLAVPAIVDAQAETAISAGSSKTSFRIFRRDAATRRLPISFRLALYEQQIRFAR